MSDYTRNHHPGLIRYNMQVADYNEIDIDQNQYGTPYEITVTHLGLEYPDVAVGMDQDHLNTLAQILDQLRTDKE